MDTSATKWTGARAAVGSRHFDLPARARRASGFLDQLTTPIEGEETVVDVGAGSGFLTLAAAARVGRGRVIAIELSPDMLRRLEHRARRVGLADRIEAIQADAAATGLESESVDVVVSYALLHELFDADAAIAEWVRVLAPGGTMLHRDVAHGWYSFIVRLLHDRRAHGPFECEDLAALLEKNGLVDVEVTRDGKLLTAKARKPATGSSARASS